MTISERIIFIHGLFGSSQGVKATLLRQRYPHILTPDFNGSLDERMDALREILGEEKGWTMLALFTTQHPEQVDKLVLFAPALIWPDFASQPPQPVDVPTVVFHGAGDEIVPIEDVRKLCQRVFNNLDFHQVDDDHGLYETVQALDWKALLED
jgi:pimeloyl-ACP methyl ester carboxylesterase